MPRPHPTPPDPDPDGIWPSCDEEQPGISIRPLRQGDLHALLAHLNHHEHDDEDEGRLAGRAGGGRLRAGRWWRCGYGPASAAPAPPLTPNTGADAGSNTPPGPAACPGGLL